MSASMLASDLVAGRSITWLRASRPSSRRFRRSTPAALRLLSMNMARAAPRLKASIPTAPDPAYASTKTFPSTSAPNTLKSVSRSRSLVGRKEPLETVFKRRERSVPPITRIDQAPSRGEKSALEPTNLGALIHPPNKTTRRVFPGGGRSEPPKGPTSIVPDGQAGDMPGGQDVKSGRYATLPGLGQLPPPPRNEVLPSAFPSTPIGGFDCIIIYSDYLSTIIHVKAAFLKNNKSYVGCAAQS